MRVLYCILDNRFGGPHRLAQAVCRQLREQGVETLFFLGQKSPDVWQPEGGRAFARRYIQCFTSHHPLRNLAAFALFLPANLRYIRDLIRSQRVDIVHVDGVSNFLPALAARLARTPIIWHYNDHPPGPLRPILLRLVRALASTVVVQGDQLRNVRTGFDPQLHAKTVVLYPGIDLRQFDPARYDAAARAQVRAQWGVPADGPLIGMVGNLNRLKGHAYFIQAAQRIKEKRPQARFLVVGRKLNTAPGYWRKLQHLTARCGLTQEIVFAGFQDDVARLLAALDVFVLPSVRESCPNVVLEAMAMKVPVVATDVGAVRELVTHEQTGLVVAPRDAEALAQAVLAVLTRPGPQVCALVEAARKRMEQDFSLDRIAGQQKQLYEDLIRAPARQNARIASHGG